MVTVYYWQWGKRVEHEERFESLDEALSFLYVHGVPQHARQVMDFAPDEIVDGDRRISGDELDRLLAEYEMR